MADALSPTSNKTNPNFPPLPRAQPYPPPSIADPPPAEIPPPPDPPPNLPTPPLPTSSQPLPLVRWSTLFASKPRSAGEFSPPTITLKYSGNRLIPTEDIVQASKEVWNDYIAGFFLDSPLSFTAVVSHLTRHWSPRGPIKIKSNGQMFFFLFSNAEDRKRILEADPLVIRNKVFILKKWNVNMGSTGKEVKKVPIWIKLSNLPMVAWTKIGICWLATHIGKFLCMDRATESLDWLSYAKVMVEISPDSELPYNIPVLLDDGTEHLVVVEYIWKPDVCLSCKHFGHLQPTCSRYGVKVQGEEIITGKVNGVSAKGADQVRKQMPAEVEGHVSKQSNHPKGMFTSNLGKSKAHPIASQEWQKVVGKKISKDKTVAAEDVQTGNSFESLVEHCDDVEADDDAVSEEGEICETSKSRDMVNNIVDASSNDDQFQTITGQDNVFSNVLDGNNENNVALPIPTTTTEFNFKPGFLNPVKPTTNPTTDGPNPMQTLLYEVSCFGLRMNSCSNSEQVSPPSAMVSSKVSALEDSIDKHLTVHNLEDFLKNNDKQKETYDNFNKLSKDKLQSVQNLDDLLKNNDKQKETYVQPEALSEGTNISTDLTTVAHQLDQNLELKNKSPAVKARTNKVHKIKTVSDLIEKLETEIASGNFSEEDCEGKRQVIASLMRNYKNNLNKPCGPYDNIPPPPGFKAPPPEEEDDSEATALNSSSLCNNRKSPVTRSMVRALRNSVFDNG